jgi:hypothetical protein
MGSHRRNRAPGGPAHESEKDSEVNRPLERESTFNVDSVVQKLGRLPVTQISSQSLIYRGALQCTDTILLTITILLTNRETLSNLVQSTSHFYPEMALSICTFPESSKENGDVEVA